MLEFPSEFLINILIRSFIISQQMCGTLLLGSCISSYFNTFSSLRLWMCTCTRLDFLFHHQVSVSIERCVYHFVNVLFALYSSSFWCLCVTSERVTAVRTDNGRLLACHAKNSEVSRPVVTTMTMSVYCECHVPSVILQSAALFSSKHI